jgi:histone H3/H4
MARTKIRPGTSRQNATPSHVARKSARKAPVATGGVAEGKGKGKGDVARQKKRRRARPGGLSTLNALSLLNKLVAALREIRHQQNIYSKEGKKLCCAKQAFARLVREVGDDFNRIRIGRGILSADTKIERWSKDALTCMQEMSEDFMIRFLHRKRTPASEPANMNRCLLPRR